MFICKIPLHFVIVIRVGNLFFWNNKTKQEVYISNYQITISLYSISIPPTMYYASALALAVPSLYSFFLALADNDDVKAFVSRRHSVSFSCYVGVVFLTEKIWFWVATDCQTNVQVT